MNIMTHFAVLTKNSFQFFRLLSSFSINDLVVVDEDRFYFSNYKYYGVDIDLAFNLHWSSVGFFDGKTAVLVDTGLLVANGIALSKDQK